MKHETIPNLNDIHVLNCTPHTLNIYNHEGEEIQTVSPSGIVLRVELAYETTAYMNGFPIQNAKVLSIDPLPAQRDGQIIVASGMYRAYVLRSDVYQLGNLMRDEEGRVIGCVGLSR